MLYSQYQEAATGTLIAAIVTVTIWSLATDTTQQTKHQADQNQQQNRADAQSSVVSVYTVLINVIVRSIQMFVRIVTEGIGNVIQPGG